MLYDMIVYTSFVFAANTTRSMIPIEPGPTIDYTCKDGHFPTSESYVTFSNPVDSLSSNETEVNPSWNKKLKKGNYENELDVRRPLVERLVSISEKKKKKWSGETL